MTTSGDRRTKIQSLCITSTDSIRVAISHIDTSGSGIVLVVDDQQRLIGTVTDGDARRAVLAGVDLDSSVGTLLEQKVNTSYSHPVTAQSGTAPDVLLRLMQEHSIRQIPLLDCDGRVTDLVTLDGLLPLQPLPLQAVIMAGGSGTRLRPLTEDLPKPMLPVGGRPLLELIIAQLQQAGIKRVNVATHYLPEKIIEHFGDGYTFGVELTYVNEDRPLGTAGALALMANPKEPLLVINGDILTQVDFRAMLEFHQEYRADMTVAVRHYDLQIPYGVVECQGSFVKQLTEKPQLHLFVNAGIYLLEPSVFEHIPSGQHTDMTDLIQRLLEMGRPVVSFPVREYWLDIGQHSDYIQAQEDFRNGRMTR